MDYLREMVLVRTTVAFMQVGTQIIFLSYIYGVPVAACKVKYLSV